MSSSLRATERLLLPEIGGSAALVTGGAGFIGSHLVEALLGAGARRVHVIDDMSLGKEANLAGVADRQELRLTVADCSDEGVLDGLGERFDFCFHLAVVPLPHSLVHPRENVERNIAMTDAICEFGRRGGFDRLVNVSSSEVYGTARTAPMSEDHPLGAHTPYAAAKAASDLVVASYVTTFGLRAVTARPFNTYGERQNAGAYAGIIPAVVNAVLSDVPFQVNGDGEQTRDMCYARDTAAAVLAIAEHDAALGGVFNIGTGEEASVNEMVRLMLEAMDHPSHPIVHGPERPGDVHRLLADTRRLREVVGFEAGTELKDGLSRTVAWYLQQADATTA
jgi:UDP-glucose 4-epimerase